MLLYRMQTQFVREEIATPLGLEDSFYMGGLSARGVEPSRIAHVEHTFKVPGRSPSRSGQEEEKESAAAGQSTQQATGSSRGGRGGRRSRGTTALVGPEISAESKQSVADEDEVVGNEDIDEVKTGRMTRSIVAKCSWIIFDGSAQG